MRKICGNYIEVDCSILQHANICKFFFQESGDGKNLPESRDSDAKKGQHVPARKGSQTAAVPRRSSEDKNEKISKESPSAVERSTKSGTKVWGCPPCCSSHLCMWRMIPFFIVPIFQIIFHSGHDDEELLVLITFMIFISHFFFSFIQQIDVSQGVCVSCFKSRACSHNQKWEKKYTDISVLNLILHCMRLRNTLL